MKKVCFVCLGNICRSPMAEFVMKKLDTEGSLFIESRATSSWEHGNPIHKGTQQIFNQYGVDYDFSKTSQQISLDDFEFFDYIIGMDKQNILDLQECLTIIIMIRFIRLMTKESQIHGIQVTLMKPMIW